MSDRTVTMQGFVRFDHEMASYSEQPFRWVPGKPEMYGAAYQSATVDSSVPITFTLPENFHPTAHMVKALEVERSEVQRAFSARIAEINEQIGKLLAITNEIPS